MTETFTNEGLANISGNTFQLIKYAIDLGRYYIASGRVCSLKDILRDVRKHPHPEYIEELKEIDQIKSVAGEKRADYE